MGVMDLTVGMSSGETEVESRLHGGLVIRGPHAGLDGGVSRPSTRCWIKP